MSACRHCPHCGQRTLKHIGRKKVQCTECSFVFYRNAASAVAVIIRCDQEILLATRGREPARGRLDLPGGFVDPGESLEQAVHREIKEELGLNLPAVAYLGSEANQYLYANVLYDTTDAFFEVRFDRKPTVTAMDDVAAVSWHSLAELKINDLAFDSQKKVLRRYCADQTA